MTITSDIDLVVLHPDGDASGWYAQIDSLADRTRQWTGNTMNSLVMSADDVRGAARAEPVLQDIASAAVPLLGDIGSYKRLIGVRQ